MKPVQEFLSDLAALDVKVWVQETRLRCNAPQGIFTPEIRAQLSERKDEIIQFLQDSHLQFIPRSPRNDEPLPLSFAQARLWFLNQLSGSTATYNMLLAISISGKLDISALQQALSEIVRRHEILRTSFSTVNGTPIQVIHPEAAININLVDLQQLEPTERESLLYQQAQTEAITPFELEIAPLIRCSLLQLSAAEYVLLVTMHHIVSDGWSIGVLIRELSTLYQAFCAGVPSPLPELAIQYADFAVWQRQWLSGEVLQSQLNYWRWQLALAPELLQLPTDRSRPVVQTYQGRTHSWTINSDLAEKLQSLSRESGTTLFMTMLAAFATLLYRYSGQSDILVGTPIANRNRSEIESLIGFFVNTLVLRTRFEEHPSFEKLLPQVRETTLKAYENQDVPFEQVVEALQPERSLSHSPLFQVMFALENSPLGELKLPGITLSELPQENTIAKFDLTVSFTETSQGLVGDWEYNTDLFDSSTIEHMAGHFQNLCRAIVENPQLSVDELPLLSEAERHQLLVEWNDTECKYPSDKCIHQLFEEQVERTPDAIAVVFDNQQLTYLELNQRANQLAHHLQSLGVRPEVLVGICIERSIEMVVGLLAILKAGGAYVPLDPTYPKERLEFMLHDSQIKVLVTLRRLVAQLPHEVQVVYFDTDSGVIEQNSTENPIVSATPENLAYVIYTSGSTGKPKGVMIPHQSLVNFTVASQIEHGLTECDRVLQFASISFDVAAEEIYPCLMFGGMLVLRYDEMLSSVSSFLQTCQDLQLTVLNLPTAYWHQIVSELTTTNLMLPESLRLVIIGGEKALLDKLTIWQQRVGTMPRLVNTYGPTEAAVVSTLCTLSDLALTNIQHVPIGRPIANAQVYVLDRYLQPVPIGVPGELYIGGAGVAQGYLNCPELTAEKFISTPFNSEVGTRIYKTGDLVRYRFDGNIEYLDRIDNQVKVRGFRIELGEIEAVLGKHPKVQQAVVVVREGISGNKRLVAYVVPQEKVATHIELRQFLKERLPEYMVPNVFVMLEVLPLTSNCKVDRHALPKPHSQSIEADFVAPRTPTEEVLAGIWAEVLGLEKVSIYDNFFILGGHSLLATQVISRLRQAFSVELPLRCLFERPTIADLAEMAIAQQLEQAESEALEQILDEVDELSDDTVTDNTSQIALIVPVSREQAIPLSFAQARLWFLNQLEELKTTYNIPFAFRLVGTLDITALEMALQEIVYRHEVLRTNFAIVNRTPVQIIAASSNLTLPVMDLQALPENEQFAEVERLTQAEAQRSFDLANDSLLQITLLQLGQESHVLLLGMHHIVFDGWSMGIFVRELSTLYQAFSKGMPSPLPDLFIQYADFAHWQHQWFQGEVLETNLSYWKKQLGDIPVLKLPTDRPRPAVQTFRGTKQSMELPKTLTEDIKALSRREGATLFMILVAAFKSMLHYYSGQDDIVIGTDVANRNRVETEEIIGFFVNQLVLRTHLSGNPTFRELLWRVCKVALEAYDHQNMPFDKLVAALNPERYLNRAPLFQAKFVLENTPMPDLEIENLTISLLEVDNGTAKFDLLLTMWETEQGLSGVLEYSTDLFNVATIVRMLETFETILHTAISQPSIKLNALIRILAEAEEQKRVVKKKEFREVRRSKLKNLKPQLINPSKLEKETRQ